MQLTGPTTIENIEYATPSDLDSFVKYENEPLEENIIKENKELLKELKGLNQRYELQKENIINEEKRKFLNKFENMQIKDYETKENVITFIDSKNETKTYKKSKLFKSFLVHHDDKLQNFELSVKDSLEDLERTINNYKEDFKKVLEKQKDLLVIAENDGLNNLKVDFKQSLK